MYYNSICTTHKQERNKIERFRYLEKEKREKRGEERRRERERERGERDI